MFTQENGVITEKRITEMALHEFLSYGPQKDGANVKPMFRKTKDGRIFEWKVVKDDPLCILQDAFVKVKRSVGFNIELKFDDILCMEKKSYVKLLTTSCSCDPLEVIYLQYLMGVEGVIIDMVMEISEAIASISVRNKEDDEEDDGTKSMIMFGEERTKVKISKM
ncbi:unnamed protein product [Brassica rapa subsp. trilocularis]